MALTDLFRKSEEYRFPSSLSFKDAISNFLDDDKTYYMDIIATDQTALNQRRDGLERRDSWETESTTEDLSYREYLPKKNPSEISGRFTEILDQRIVDEHGADFDTLKLHPSLSALEMKVMRRKNTSTGDVGTEYRVQFLAPQPAKQGEHIVRYDIRMRDSDVVHGSMRDYGYDLKKVANLMEDKYVRSAIIDEVSFDGTPGRIRYQRSEDGDLKVLMTSDKSFYDNKDLMRLFDDTGDYIINNDEDGTIQMWFDRQEQFNGKEPSIFTKYSGPDNKESYVEIQTDGSENSYELIRDMVKILNIDVPETADIKVKYLRMDKLKDDVVGVYNKVSDFLSDDKLRADFNSVYQGVMRMK